MICLRFIKKEKFASFKDRMVVPLYSNPERDTLITNLLVACPPEEKPSWIISNIAFLMEK